MEYLQAAELGVEHRSRGYIRARLDAAARLAAKGGAREDKKCGASGIAKHKKCKKPITAVAIQKRKAKNRNKAITHAVGIGLLGSLAFTYGAAYGRNSTGVSPAALNRMGRRATAPARTARVTAQAAMRRSSEVYYPPSRPAATPPRSSNSTAWMNATDRKIYAAYAAQYKTKLNRPNWKGTDDDVSKAWKKY